MSTEIQYAGVNRRCSSPPSPGGVNLAVVTMDEYDGDIADEDLMLALGVSSAPVVENPPLAGGVAGRTPLQTSKSFNASLRSSANDGSSGNKQQTVSSAARPATSDTWSEAGLLRKWCCAAVSEVY